MSVDNRPSTARSSLCSPETPQFILRQRKSMPDLLYNFLCSARHLLVPRNDSEDICRRVYLESVNVSKPRRVYLPKVFSWNIPVHSLILLSFLAVGCGKQPPVVQPQVVEIIKTVEVQIPVPVKAQPPAELLASRPIPLPVFVPPSDPQASSALTPDGERLLRALLEELLSTIEAWRAWAQAP